MKEILIRTIILAGMLLAFPTKSMMLSNKYLKYSSKIKALHSHIYPEQKTLNSRNRHSRILEEIDTSKTPISVGSLMSVGDYMVKYFKIFFFE